MSVRGCKHMIVYKSLLDPNLTKSLNAMYLGCVQPKATSAQIIQKTFCFRVKQHLLNVVPLFMGSGQTIQMPCLVINLAVHILKSLSNSRTGCFCWKGLFGTVNLNYVETMLPRHTCEHFQIFTRVFFSLLLGLFWDRCTE